MMTEMVTEKQYRGSDTTGEVLDAEMALAHAVQGKTSHCFHIEQRTKIRTN